MIPRATYRLQFHAAFTFADAIPLARYFRQLGISHLYASPILTARAGSNHGYDVIDHTQVNPELGGEPGFRALVKELRDKGLGLIVDIVPNHMAVGGDDNSWWLDVLENGQASAHAATFDIDWDPPDATLRGKVLVPVLGASLCDAIAASDIKLIWDANLRKLAFAYHDHRFPLRREDYAEVIGAAAEPESADLAAWNQSDTIAELLARQHYRLAFWQTAPDAINWRSFFDVTGLAALRIEDERVFETVHAKIFQLYCEGLIDGVRVDHVDGLTDPAGYCRRLRLRLDALAAQRPANAPDGRAYVVVEKILASDEALPSDWGIDGTTGYDFMNGVSAVQHDAAGEEPLTRLWKAIGGRPADFETEERSARRELLHESFACHLRAAAASFHRLALFAAREMPDSMLQPALGLLLEHFHSYRTYATGDAAGAPPGPYFESALAAARLEIAAQEMPALDFIAQAMRGELAEFGKVTREAVRHFNQLAAPLAAKAVEDTAFFRYGRLLSRNDVGFSPAMFAFSPAQFAERSRRRQSIFPHALLATATHDHKRGEDVRARLAVLSELPREWEREVKIWFDLNAHLRQPEIDAGDEYQLYQTLVGSFPADWSSEPGHLGAYTDRILGWREKSLREAKLRTSWKEPNASFEAANAAFVRAILDPSQSGAFLARLSASAERISLAGALNGIVQSILRCTLPGVPDLYQGAEFWDLSLVDPDNRRPVDFAARRAAMASIEGPAALLPRWKTGHVKQSLIGRLLVLRAQNPACFNGGDYVPLAVQGTRAEHVLSFLRVHKTNAILIAVPRLCAPACIESGTPLPASLFWDNTRVLLPEARPSWQSALNGSRFDASDSLACSNLFAEFPGAVLISEKS